MVWKVIAVYLCYWGIHSYENHTDRLGTTGRRCKRCKYEPRWDR
jgi:hypothetical protein